MKKYSHSRIATFMECPHKYYLRDILRIVPKKKAKPLVLGGCMADGLACFRETGDIDKAENAFIKKWRDEDQTLDVKKDADPKRSVERGLEILGEYALTYPDDPSQVVKPEVRFDEEIAPGIRFRGRIDGLMDVDDLAIVEDKTTSWLTATYLSQQQKSFQVLWYLWIARKLGYFKLSKSGRPKLLFNAILIDEKKFEFVRRTIPKTNKEIDAAFDRLLEWIGLMQLAEENNIFPKADMKVCLKWGGCDYLPLRDAMGSIHDRLLKNEYEIRAENDGDMKNG